MWFDSFAEFIQMGKHGLYVWSAYGFTLVCMFGLVSLSSRQFRRWINAQKHRSQRLSQQSSYQAKPTIDTQHRHNKELNNQ